MSKRAMHLMKRSTRQKKLPTRVTCRGSVHPQPVQQTRTDTAEHNRRFWKTKKKLSLKAYQREGFINSSSNQHTWKRLVAIKMQHKPTSYLQKKGFARTTRNVAHRLGIKRSCAFRKTPSLSASTLSAHMSSTALEQVVPQKLKSFYGVTGILIETTYEEPLLPLT